jgi:3-deoxy-D-manno-octulosonic-acid transferase
MHLFYSFLLGLTFIALLPYFAYQAVFKQKYLANLRERFGFFPAELKNDGRPTIWLHAVSVGEALTAGALLDALRLRWPGHRLIISTTTATGQAVARTRLKSVDGVTYFPFDWRFVVRRVLDHIRPELIILMESELWPNFLEECRQRRIPVLVANGRISDRSFARSRQFGSLMRWLYRKVTRFAMQSETDAERARGLGAPFDRVFVCGNIKYDLGEPKNDQQRISPIAELAEKLSIDSSQLVIAGSTTEGEEEIVMEAIKEVRRAAGCEGVRLLLAPRHPERFESVAALLTTSGQSFTRRSKIAKTSNPPVTDVILLDSIGELAGMYRYASAVFVGGSLVPKGGHNILEPALSGRPIIVGPHMENFREITRDFLAREALVQIQGLNVDDLRQRLAEGLTGLLTDRPRANRLGANARAAVEANRGATERHLKLIEELLDPAKR